MPSIPGVHRAPAAPLRGHEFPAVSARLIVPPMMENVVIELSMIRGAPGLDQRSSFRRARPLEPACLRRTEHQLRLSNCGDLGLWSAALMGWLGAYS